MKTNSPSQGDVWLFDPGREIGKKIRSCLIISNNLINKGSSELLIIIPLTSAFKGIPSHVRIEPPEGKLDKLSFAMCEQIRCISKERLVEKLGTIQSKIILKEIQSWIHDFIRLD